MNKAWAAIEVSTPPRGPGSQAKLEFFAKSITVTSSWGAEPGSAAITYVSESGNYDPIAAGASMKILTKWGHLFFGVCEADRPTLASSGKERTLSFVDLRLFLAWDEVFGIFNRVDKRLEGGRLVKRYRHILPADFDNMEWSFTSSPYTASQVINFLLGAPTVNSNWAAVFHEDQLQWPVLDLDFSGGKKLAAALLEVSERQGLVFGLLSTEAQPYRLVWVRKGYGPTVTLPANRDNVRLGSALSGNPNRVRVLGDRNRYQLLNWPLTPDWNRKWEEYWDYALFADWVFRNCTTRPSEMDGVAAGVAYSAIPGDTEQLIGRFLANARASTMTLRELDALRVDGDFSDGRLFGGRSRNDLPAKIYIESILFRAFRPVPPSLNGRTLKLSSLRLVGEMLGKVVVDAAHASSPMTYAVGADVPQGNGVVLARGYQLGQEVFRLSEPKRFDPAAWLRWQDLWSPVAFQIDESGEDGGFVVAEAPVVRTTNLVVVRNGYAVLRADPTFEVPPMLGALTFEAERFSWWKPYRIAAGDRNHTEQVSDLRGEYVALFGGLAAEVPFDDGLLAGQKADAVADTILTGQWSYLAGDYERPLQDGDIAMTLTGMIDRVTVRQGADGFVETVDFTTERRSRAFLPGRDYDRRLRERSLLPAEARLRYEADDWRRLAFGMRGDRAFAKTVGREFHGLIGSAEPLHVVTVASGAGVLPIGTPLFRKPATTQSSGFSANTQAVAPAASGSEHNIFCGATVRDEENASRPLKVQRSGVGLVRVKGPVESGDRVVVEPGQDYLVKKGEEQRAEVGTAQKGVQGTSVVLIEVQFGGGGGGTTVSGEARWA